MRLTRERYAAHVAADGRRLGDVARIDPTASVPSCPGWTVADLVAHTGVIHRHKEQIVRERLLTSPPRPEAPTDHGHLIDWFMEGVDLLVETLAKADPTGSVTTFYRPDQTVGFWQRRMAHETVIHRIDAELAVNAVTPIDPTLAADGLDEVMSPVRAGIGPSADFAPDGRVAVIRSCDTGDTWRVDLGRGPDGATWRWSSGGAPNPDTVIGAAADVLDRWAWGRAEAELLSVDGDPSIPPLLRAVVARVT